MQEVINKNEIISRFEIAYVNKARDWATDSLHQVSDICEWCSPYSDPWVAYCPVTSLWRGPTWVDFPGFHSSPVLCWGTCVPNVCQTHFPLKCSQRYENIVSFLCADFNLQCFPYNFTSLESQTSWASFKYLVCQSLHLTCDTQLAPRTKIIGLDYNEYMFHLSCQVYG